MPAISREEANKKVQPIADADPTKNRSLSLEKARKIIDIIKLDKN